jgi:hypothetical protein
MNSKSQSLELFMTIQMAYASSNNNPISISGENYTGIMEKYL